MAVDIGYLYAARNELQNAADAAALAGARELGKIYSAAGMYVKNTASGGDTYKVFVAAKDVAGKNVAASESVTLNVFAFKKNPDGSDSTELDPNNVSTDGADVVLGEWQWTAASGTDKLKTSGVSQPDAVRVYAKREKDVNPVTLFFARVMGIADAGVSAVATAVLSGLSEANEGDLEIPIGISKYWWTYYPDGFCDQNIKFYPTGTIEGCAGWHTYTTSPSSAEVLKGAGNKPGILDGLLTGDFQSPATILGQDYSFIGGNVTPAFDDLKALYDAKKKLVDGQWIWETTVVVYDRNDCSNPNKENTIVGFAAVKIFNVAVTPAKTIEATVLCNKYEDNTRGGGTYYGIKGTIPGLVQ